MSLGYVRPARPGDAEQVARVQLTTWRTAYPQFIPRFAIDEVDADWLAQRWHAAITEPPSPQHHVLVAVEQADESHVVGFAAIGPADEAALAPDETPEGWQDVAAITDLLVEPRWGRRGHGSRLLAAAVDLWRADGFATAVAWAFEKDVATVKFLTSTGWERDGAARALDIEGVLAPQARLHVSLDEPTAEAAAEPESGG
ncbi:MAG: GNAT family N-acetyltransferase [Dehalococcoidia bacterium]